MNSRTTLSALSLFGIAAFACAPALARGPGPIAADRQAQLMERFGDEGIDADADGELTREEIRTFIREQFGEDAAPAFGRFGRRHGFGRGQDAIGETLRALDRLDDKLAEKPAIASGEEAADARSTDAPAVKADRPVRGERLRERLTRRLLHMAPEADANADGTLDEQELADLRTKQRERVKASIIDRHPDADTDENGVLSDEELEAFHAARKAERIERVLERHPDADLDGDGTLSESEFEALRDEFGPPRRDFRGHGRRSRFIEKGEK